MIWDVTTGFPIASFEQLPILSPGREKNVLKVTMKSHLKQWNCQSNFLKNLLFQANVMPERSLYVPLSTCLASHFALC